MTRPPRRVLAAWFAIAVVGALPAACGGSTSADDAARSSASPPAGASPTPPPTSPTHPTPAGSAVVPATPDPSPSAGPPVDPSVPASTPPTASTAPEVATSAAAEFGVAFPGPGWTRPDGSRADTRRGINLIAGSDHCDWDRASLLHVPWPLDAEVRDSRDLRQYVWDPGGQLEELGITRDGEVVDVPDHAAATGFATAHQQLWLGDDADEFAYLVGDDDVVRRLERPVVEPSGVLACR